MRIKVEFYMDPDGMDPDHVDLNHEMGVSEEGHLAYTNLFGYPDDLTFTLVDD